MANIPGNGLVLRQRQDASCKSDVKADKLLGLTPYSALSEQYVHSGLKVYMNGDGADVYEDKFMKLAKANDGTFTPTLILVGIRLGIDRVTPVYWDALKAILRIPQSIGIAGCVQRQNLIAFQ